MKAFSLLETVVALGLLALILPLAFNLIPGGLFAQGRAEDIQVATAFAAGWVEEAVSHPAAQPGQDRDQRVVLGHLNYRAQREFFAVPGNGPELTDVVVTLTPDRGPPIRVATRIYKQ